MDTTDTYHFNKEDYSEYVIRNSVYWLSRYSAWTLDETTTEWIITLDKDSPNIHHQLSRLINDYKLREKIAEKTQHLRDSIIEKALYDIEASI